MKTPKIASHVLFAGAAILACSGCSLFQKKSSVPAIPASAMGTGQSTTGNQQNPGQSTAGNYSQRPQVSSATMRASSTLAQRPGRTLYSSFNNLIDPWQNPMSDGIVWIQNMRQELVSIELGDRAVGIPDQNGNLVRLVLPPGETFGIPDYKQRPEGYGAKTQIKVIIVDDDDIRIGYLLSKPIAWPIRGYYSGKEIQWMIREGDPVQAEPGPAPIKIPVRIQDIPATEEITSQGATAAPTSTAPAQTPPAPTTH